MMSGMHQAAVVVKVEPGWSLPAGSCGVSEAAARAGLYNDHEVKDELVVGPECLQPRNAVYALCEVVHAPNSLHRDHTYASMGHAPAVLIKEEVELVLEADCSGEELEYIKQEPSWSVGAGACGGSAAAARAELRAAHGGEGAVGAGPESLQPRDGGYIPPKAVHAPNSSHRDHTYASMGLVPAVLIKKEVNLVVEADCSGEELECIKQEPSWSVGAGACGGSAAAARAGLRAAHGGEGAVVAGPESLQPRDGGYIPPMLVVGACSSGRPAPSPSTHTTPALNTTRGTALSLLAVGRCVFTPAHRKKEHTCGVCGKKCLCQSHLKTHERVHTGERPYSCGVCSKQFKQRGSLTNHELIHTGEKPYSCGVCSKKFTQQRNLKIHERIHTGRSPYVCEICTKRFSQSTDLKRHILIHTGEKPYSCDMCVKRFSRKGSLERHIWSHARKEHSTKTSAAPPLCGKCAMHTGAKAIGAPEVETRRQ